MSNLKQEKEQRIALASSNQRMAADPNYSVWVEASAGTGKTKVLSDRVLRLLLEGVNPSRLLCLTYTKAAAVEMSNRIAERLSNWAILDDDTLSLELEKLLGLNSLSSEQLSKLMPQARKLFAVLLDTPGGIKIQTIHSFCQEILKRFPLEAKISPYFEVMDDRQAKEAMENIKTEILQGNLSPQAREALSWLTSEVSEFKFPDIMSSISENRNLFNEYLSRQGSLEALISQTSAKLNLPLDINAQDIKTAFWEGTSAADFSLLIKALSEGSDKSVQNSLKLSSAVQNQDFELACDILLTIKQEPRKDILQKKPLMLFPDAAKSYNSISAALISAVNKLKSLNLLNSTRAVLTLSSELLKRYQTYKKLHSKMDYNDLIILTKHLLEDASVAQWILYKLDGGIDHILIDEAQDTSPEQWSIIKSLTQDFFSGLSNREKPATVFVVGDRKQSIYSFQGADPREFERMHTYFKGKISDFKDVNMEVSFRSTSAVLDSVNKVFAQGAARDGVVNDGQELMHIPSRIGDGGRIELWPLVQPDDNDISDQIWLPPVERVSGISSSSKLARQIAETIKSKVSQKEILQSQGRPLRYRDFLILVQRRNSFVEEIVRACKNAGVNITGVDKIKLSEQIAVNDLLALAQFTLLPSDDLNLACVLKSPLFGLNDDDLFTLCYQRGEKSLWQRLKESSSYPTIAETLYQILKFANTHRPFEFFSYILNELQGQKKFISRLGFECTDTLDEFINLSLSFEQEHIPTLQLFVEWMHQDDVEIKRNLEQNDLDAVRLMTVHGSKGLQAPIVILPDTVRVKSIKQESGWLYDDDTLFYPLGKEYYESTCCRLKEQEKALSLEEYHRLLYVALTRAEERLCICGYQKKHKPSQESWYEICQTALRPLLSQTADNDILFYQTEQQIPPKNKTETLKKRLPLDFPQWLTRPAPQQGPLARPLTPSHLDEDKVSALSPLLTQNDTLLYSRGRLIHKLLQFIPSAEPKLRSALIAEFFKTQAPELSPTVQDQIATEVLNLIEDTRFSALFGPNSLAEVPLMGRVGDNIISGQIDRLVVTDNKVIIVDYKTNRPAAQTLQDVPPSYLKQMKAYRELISQIYPDLSVETYILWTNTAQMMKIE